MKQPISCLAPAGHLAGFPDLRSAISCASFGCNHLRQIPATASALKSAVFESEEYESIVDTGTTVTIEPKTDSSQRVDPRERIKISGFDGHVTQSLGVARGTVAFGTNRSGASVRLKMPTSHVVPGTPHALLSVSAMVRAGYTFQFSQSGSYMVTPSMDIVDLIERG
jgi:hypothetical protein